jgi:hypothetical protein
MNRWRKVVWIIALIMVTATAIGLVAEGLQILLHMLLS